VSGLTSAMPLTARMIRTFIGMSQAVAHYPWFEGLAARRQHFTRTDWTRRASILPRAQCAEQLRVLGGHQASFYLALMALAGLLLAVFRSDQGLL